MAEELEDKIKETVRLKGWWTWEELEMAIADAAREMGATVGESNRLVERLAKEIY